MVLATLAVLNAAAAGTGAFRIYRVQARATASVRYVSCLPAAALHERPAWGRAFIPLCHPSFFIYVCIEERKEEYRATLFRGGCLL